MSKIIKIAIYKDGKRTFEELDYDLYLDLLQLVNPNNQLKSNKAILDTVKVSQEVCSFKKVIKQFINKIKTWI